jgi:8-oxo-dGTP pyrophosphatase MutT (NUDIX family)
VNALPPDLLERARAFAHGRLTVADARHAATVILLRDGSGGSGLEVYLLRRASTMAFAAGQHVFPGGSVDQRDGEHSPAWSGRSASAWGESLGCDATMSRALVCAAVRETFEESGVLLAGASPDELLADVSSDEWEAERAALEARQHSLSELLTRRNLVLRSDLLRPLAHWITPEVEPRRFDTRFFLARLPAGQVTRTAGTEADKRLWVRPAEALDSGLTMLPPTRAVLADLASYDDVDAALAAERTVSPILPKLVLGAGGELTFLRPGDDGYLGA